jgi:hypothetical protein
MKPSKKKSKKLDIRIRAWELTQADLKRNPTFVPASYRRPGSLSK